MRKPKIECFYVVVIFCFLSVSAQTPVAVQFANSTGQKHGVVEVRMSDGTWGTICDTGADDTLAEVICAMLGYEPYVGNSYKLSSTIRGNGTVAISVGSCPSVTSGDPVTYTIVRGCTFSLPTSMPPACADHSRDVSVGCFGSLTTASPTTTTTTTPGTPNTATLAPVNCTNGTDGQVALRPSGVEGLLIVQDASNSTNFGTVCASGFTTNEAKTICNMLCASTTNAIPLTGKYVESVTEDIILSGLKCPSWATSITNCTHNGWGNKGECGTSKSLAVAVRCSPLSSSPPPVPIPTLECMQLEARITFLRSEVNDTSLLKINTPYDVSLCNFTVSQNATHTMAVIPHFGCNSSTLGSNLSHVIYTAYLFKNATLEVNVYIDSSVTYPLRCALARDQTATAAPIQDDTKTVTPINSGETYSADIQLYRTYSDGTFTSPINRLDKIEIGTKIYARISVLKEVPESKLIIKNCWASDRETGGSTYSIIEDKCPKIIAGYTPYLYKVNDLIAGIHLKVAAFPTTTGSSSNLYIFCQTKLCRTSETIPQCLQICGTAVRRRKRDATDIDKQLHNGPFILVNSSAHRWIDFQTSSAQTISIRYQHLFTLFYSVYACIEYLLHH